MDGDPSERTLLRVVVVVLAITLLAVVKPWGDGTGPGAGSAPRSAQGAASPTIAASAGPTPLPTPVDPASTFCLTPSGWRLTSLEVFDGQTIRVWQTIDPVQATGPTDPAAAGGAGGLDLGPRGRLVRPDRPGRATRATGHDPDLVRPAERDARRCWTSGRGSARAISGRTTRRRTSARAPPTGRRGATSSRSRRRRRAGRGGSPRRSGGSCRTAPRRHRRTRRPRRYHERRMDLGLTGHRALVGGGSGGLGGAIATALRAEGAAVALVARESARLTDQAARLDASAVPADLSTPDGPAAAVDRRRGRARRPRPARGQHRRPAARALRGPRRGRLGQGDRRHAPRARSGSSAPPCRPSARAATRPSW